MGEARNSEAVEAFIRSWQGVERISEAHSTIFTLRNAGFMLSANPPNAIKAFICSGLAFG
jgi:hypothetical protein